MSKVCYKFDLTDPDDREEFLRTTKATDMALVLWEVVFNSKRTVEDEFDYRVSEGMDTVQPSDVIEYTYNHILELLEAHDINIDKLIS